MAAATARRTAPAIRTYGKNFPLLLETARECLQDVYDMPALNEVMTGLQAGTITVKDVETESPSPFAENIHLWLRRRGDVQYDQPQAERSAQLLSLDPTCSNACSAPPIWHKCSTRT